MKNNEKMTPEEKINTAIDNFEILKDNIDNFSIREQLEMASSIINNLSTDESVLITCLENPNLSEKRKQLLDCIHEMQMNLIQQNIKKDEDVSFSGFSVTDFDKAKVALSEMVDKELALNMFSEKDYLALYEKIKECKTHVTTLEGVSSDCKYSKYKVLLMGDFQSGKTTTFDAFCEGRHIGAIGKGAATSAVLISATYAEEESFIIHWKHKEQFYAIFERIKQYLQDFDWKSFSLDDAQSRNLLYNEIENVRQSKNCPDVGKGDSKFLMLCSFILKYYDTTKLQEKKSSLKSVSEISEITKFPDKSESTWQKFGVDKFTVDDVIFTFIDKVDCYVPSKVLKNLNCTIIDSPGLFNSAYDTMVTEMAMREANAIMFILPYYKGMGKDICQSLYTIKDNYPDVHRKLFIVNNLKFTDDNDFFDSNCDQIESMFGAEKHVYPYDGKLAYFTQLKKLYTSELASQRDYDHLMTVEIKTFGKATGKKVFENFEDAWKYHTKKYEMEGNSIDEILETSGFERITKELKQFIAHNESYAVIVSNGLLPMRHEMVSIANSLLRSYIEPYNTSHDRLVEIWEKRIEIATKFQEYVRTEAKKKLFETKENLSSLLDRMAEEEYSKLFTYDFYTRLTEEISGVLYDNKKDLMVTKTIFKTNKEEFKKRFSRISSPWIEEKIMELVGYKINYLVDNMEKGQDKTVENMFAPVIVNLEKELIAEWDKQFENAKVNGIPMENYLAIPRNLILFDKKVNEINPGINDQKTDKHDFNNLSGSDVGGSLLGGLVAEISVVVAGIATMITGYITAIICDPTGLSQVATLIIIAILLGFSGLVVILGGPEVVRNKFVKVLSNKIDSNVRTNAVAGFKKIVKAHLENTFNKYVNELSVDINKLRNERDIALASDPNQESLCFKALEAQIRVHEQVKKYDDYKTTYLKDETH